MLTLRWNSEVSKNHTEYKKIVYSQGFLDEVAGQELKPWFGTEPQIHDSAKQHGCGNPRDAPGQRLPRVNLVRLAVEHKKIEREQA